MTTSVKKIVEQELLQAGADGRNIAQLVETVTEERDEVSHTSSYFTKRVVQSLNILLREGKVFKEGMNWKLKRHEPKPEPPPKTKRYRTLDED